MNEHNEGTTTVLEPEHEHDANRDPITGAPGSHPVGTGVGAAGGAAAGAMAGGAVGGPVGAVVGGAVGAVAGGLGGKAVAEQVNPTVEDAYWRDEWKTREYTDTDAYDYDTDYRPAYRYGWEARTRHVDRDWDDRMESELSQEWNELKGESRLKWEEAKHATKDAWHRVERAIPGDFYNDEGYWRDSYASRPYYTSDYEWDDYRPAYQYGYHAYPRYRGREWDDRLESELSQEWNEFKGESRLTWEKAKHATKDAWHRVERALPGDFDRDGR
jgi:hypothetical protein